MSLQMSIFSELNTNVSAECVLFGFDFNELKVLLVEKTLKPKKKPEITYNYLPFDQIRNIESLDESAQRIILDLIGLKDIEVKQFFCFGQTNRTKNEIDVDLLKSLQYQPDDRIISVGFFSLVNQDALAIEKETQYYKIKWCSVNDLPQLAFDHKNIITKALESLYFNVKFLGTGLELLPAKFTLTQVQKLYEVLLNRPMDKRNFRRKILASGLFRKLATKEKGVAHKPAKYFQINKEKYQLLNVGEIEIIF